VRHLVRLAIGRDSAVVAEGQILHQLRVATNHARVLGGMPAELDRLCDLALRAGRVARSWLPARRTNLAEVALSRALGDRNGASGSVLVVGAGEMGRHAAAGLLARGYRVLIASRTPERARAAAEQLGTDAVDFEPRPETLAALTGTVVALAGPWRLSDAARRELSGSPAWMIDLSAPPALDEELCASLGERLTTIDDLVGATVDAPSASLLARLDDLAEQTVDEYAQWSAAAARRSAAHALQSLASDVEASELERLWQRTPGLSGAERDEIARAIRRVTHNLLRDPLERISEDGDGRHARAARELFRL